MGTGQADSLSNQMTATHVGDGHLITVRKSKKKRYFTFNSSTSKISVALGGITPLAPLGP